MLRYFDAGVGLFRKRRLRFYGNASKTNIQLG